jgi:hypothetical protein
MAKSRYDEHWKLLKQNPGSEAGIEVELSPPNLTEHQADKAFRTLCKAIQKRKLLDIPYNRTHVGAKLQSSRNGLRCRFYLIELISIGVDDL